MVIHSAVYDLLYQIVADRFFKELTLPERKSHGKMSPVLWGIKRDGVPLLWNILQGQSSELRIISRTRGDIRRDTETHGSGLVKDRFIIALFEYSGVNTNVPDLNKSLAALTDIQAKEKAEILQQFFLETYYPRYLKDNAYLRVTDVRSDEQQYTAEPTPEIQEETKETDVKKDQKKASNLTSANGYSENEKLIANMVTDFFGLLGNKKFDEASHFSIPSNQPEFRVNIEQLFIDTIEIKNISVFDIYVDEWDAKCKVCFEEHRTQRRSPVLDILHKSQFKNYDAFSQALKSLVDEAAALGIVDFKDVFIHDLFFNFNDVQDMELDTERSNLEKLFPNVREVNILRLFDVDITFEEDKYYIEEAYPLFTNTDWRPYYS